MFVHIADIYEYRYWEDEEQTKMVMQKDPSSAEVWMHTGDQAMMDTEGYLKSSPSGHRPCSVH